jgi:hypothetical protein
LSTRRVGDPKLGVDVLGVVAGGLRRDFQPLGDALVRLGQRTKYVCLADGEGDRRVRTGKALRLPGRDEDGING